VSDQAKVIALFPYLFFESETVTCIDGLVLKSSYKNNIDGEEKEVAEFLIAVAKCFRAARDKEFPIGYWSYAVLDIGTHQEFDDSIKMIGQIADVLRFIALSKKEQRAQYANFNFWMFQLDPRMKLNGEYVYLESFMNGVLRNGFNVKEGIATNPFLPEENVTPEVILSSDLDNNFYFSAIYIDHNALFKEPLSRQKIIRAIEWFNRSFSHGQRGVDSSEAITNMHSALEALLRPQHDERGSVKPELMAALMVLLGQRMEIAQWFDSFHSLRNSLVHGSVKPVRFQYVHKKGKVGNRPHLLLARRVFVECLEQILHAAKRLPLFGFEEELIPNEVRIEIGLKLLSSARKSTWSQVASDEAFKQLGRLRTDDISSPKEKALEVGKLLLPLAREELRSSNDNKFDEAITQIDTILGWSFPDDLTLLALAYSNLKMSYQTAYFDQEMTSEQRSFRAYVYPFIDYAAWRLLAFWD
jgi:hypothetical protein